MKTYLRPSRRCIIVIGGALLALAAARADDPPTVIKFSDPTKPGSVKITIARGDVRVRGVDSKEVTVKAEAKAVTQKPRNDGLRVISASSSFALSEKNNVIVIDATTEGWERSGDFEVNVPITSSVLVSNSWGGTISCSNLSGDVEVKSMNGRIKLDGLAGGALVETMNGEISANVRELRDGKPLSFTSMNGQIVIRVPDDGKANVSLRSQNGAILTDFDEKALITETKSVPRNNGKRVQVQRSGDDDDEIRNAVHEGVQAGVEAAREVTEAVREMAEAMKDGVRDAKGEPRISLRTKLPGKVVPPMTGGKIVSGTLNGGGTDIQAATMNGDVVLRKLDSKK